MRSSCISAAFVQWVVCLSILCFFDEDIYVFKCRRETEIKHGRVAMLQISSNILVDFHRDC